MLRYYLSRLLCHNRCSVKIYVHFFSAIIPHFAAQWEPTSFPSFHRIFEAMSVRSRNSTPCYVSILERRNVNLILHFRQWQSNPQPVGFTVTRLQQGHLRHDWPQMHIFSNIICGYIIIYRFLSQQQQSVFIIRNLQGKSVFPLITFYLEMRDCVVVNIYCMCGDKKLII